VLSHRTKLTCSLPDVLRVILTREAFVQLFGYVYATDSEISCLGTVRRFDNLFVIERFYLLKQKGGSAHTELESDAVAELLEELIHKGEAEEARSLKCWAHSHPRMEVFWSKTDEETCRRLASDYLVSLVVSDGFAIRCRLDTRMPITFTVDHVPVICELMPDEGRLSQYQREVEEKVARELHIAASVRQTDFLTPLADETFCASCGNWHAPGRCPVREGFPCAGDVDDWFGFGSAREFDLDRDL